MIVVQNHVTKRLNYASKALPTVLLKISKEI